MTCEIRERIFCASCGAENPKVSRCIQCGNELPKLEEVPGINPKDFVQKPRGIWLFIFLLFAGFLRSCMGLTVAPSTTIFVVLMIVMLVNGGLLFGLWKLKPWARYAMLLIGYAGLVITIWPFLFFLILPEHYYQKIVTMFYGKIWGALYSISGPMIMKFLLVKALIAFAILGAMVVYFHLPSIKQIFEEEPRGI